MTLNEFMTSAEFSLLMDETLREEARKVAEAVLAKTSPVKRHQIYAIPSILQGEGYIGLLDMCKNQKNKNSKEANKAFWREIDDILSPESSSDTSLYRFVQSLLQDRKFLENEAEQQGKVERKQVRKRNKELTKMVMDHISAVYFEHFTCHYFFVSQAQTRRS
jgi:hypothetical protein